MRLLIALPLLAACLTPNNYTERRFEAECVLLATCGFEESERPTTLASCEARLEDFDNTCDRATFCTVDMPVARTCITELEWHRQNCEDGWPADEDVEAQHYENMTDSCSSEYINCDDDAWRACIDAL